jgi:hypothetical protein
MPNPIDLAGQTFGRLTALHPERLRGKYGWLCRCACGNEVVQTSRNLTSGNTRSCGCFRRVRGRRKCEVKTCTGEYKANGLCDVHNQLAPEELSAVFEANGRRYYKRQEKHRARQLMVNYGITIADWDRMFEEQGGVCAACRRPSPDGGRLHVDHNHKTKKVRGLLCSPCNIIIGQADEQPSRLRGIADYVEAHEEPALQVVEEVA